MIITVIELPTKQPFIKEVPYQAGKNLLYYLQGVDLTNKRVIVSGKVQEIRYIPKRHDNIIAIQNIKAPIGVAIWAIASAAWAAIAAHPFIIGAFLLTSAYSIYSFLTMPRGFNTGSGLDQSSPTYTWEGGRTIQEVGVPVPIVYGIHKVWGNIINQYQTTDGDNNYVHLLLLLCEGPILGVSDVKINDIAIEEYEGASYETRLGTNTQEPVSGFSELHAVNDINIQLDYNEPFIYTTKANDVEALELYFGFPQGLYEQEI